jgi:Zn-dependent protease
MLGFGNPIVFLIASIFLIPAIAIAVPVHELGHGLAAYLAGDPSPRNRGYLRPQLRPFINVYGVVAAFLANVTWGTPIPINEYRLQGPWRKLAHALGGPVANLAAAVLAGVAIRSLLPVASPDPTTFVQPPAGLLATLCYAIYFLNLSTFAFNLLPVPGLDGWRVIEALFRNRNPRFFFDVAARTQTIWLIAVLVVIIAPVLLRFSVLDAAVAIFFQPASNVIVGQCAGYVVLHPCLL